MNKKELGSLGEKIAQYQLEKIGYKILESNYYTRFGEIDLIAKDGKTLVFVEVRTKNSTRYGTAIESMSNRKKQHFINTVHKYLQVNKKQETPYRIDFVALDKTKSGTWNFKLIRSAF